MRLATQSQAARIDEISQTHYGLSGEALMEAAGAITAREIDLTYLPELARGSVALVCGPGNNGGDGLAVARHLHSAGYRDLNVYLIAPEEKRSPLFLLQLKRLKALNLGLIDLLKNPEQAQSIKTASLIVDGIFAIGLKRPIGEPYRKIIEIMNAAQAPTVSLDAPSGLNCDTGRVEGVAVKASMTMTFAVAKPGFFICEGPRFVGKLRVLSIGFPQAAVKKVARSHFLFTERMARRYLPSRQDTSNKSDHGHVLVIAGRPGFWGAGILTSTAAFRMGAGYVTWASFETPYEVLKEIPEVLTAPSGPESKITQGRLSRRA